MEPGVLQIKSEFRKFCVDKSCGECSLYYPYFLACYNEFLYTKGGFPTVRGRVLLLVDETLDKC